METLRLYVIKQLLKLFSFFLLIDFIIHKQGKKEPIMDSIFQGARNRSEMEPKQTWLILKEGGESTLDLRLIEAVMQENLEISDFLYFVEDKKLLNWLPTSGKIQQLSRWTGKQIVVTVLDFHERETLQKTLFANSDLQYVMVVFPLSFLPTLMIYQFDTMLALYIQSFREKPFYTPFPRTLQMFLVFLFFVWLSPLGLKDDIWYEFIMSKSSFSCHRTVQLYR